MYFFASLSICASAPSSVTSVEPLIATHLYASFGSTTRSDARGSRSRCSGFARPVAVLNETFPSSTSTQTTVECGEPSPRSVVTTPTNGFSSRNCRSLSFSAATSPPPGCLHPKTTLGVSVFPNERPATHRDKEGPLFAARQRERRLGGRRTAAARLVRLPRDRRSPRRRAAR